MVRSGIGYDSHRLVEGRPLILAGQRIPFDRGLAGHSDADVVAHAVADAILGAAAAGDIGSWFPDTDPTWKGADSMVLLRRAREQVERLGYQVRNVDVTIILERPHLGGYKRGMSEGLASELGIPLGAVSVKAKTNEGMGFVGQGEGIVVLAVATVEGGA